MAKYSVEQLQAILKYNFVNSSEPLGRCYLSPDGSFISTLLYDDEGTEEVFGEPNHASVIDWLYDNNYIESDSMTDFEDLGFIKLSNWDSAIILNKNRPTSKQLWAIKEWLNYEIDYEGMDSVHVDAPNDTEWYHFNDANAYSPKDIVQKISRYYSTGKLLESLSPMDYVDKAKKIFGTTTNPEKAAWINLDGSMLNFGYNHYKRIDDHRQISRIFDDDDELIQTDDMNPYGETSDGMMTYMYMGNIRWIPETNGFDLEASKEPTDAQYSTIYRILNRIYDYVTIDISDNKRDRVVDSTDYEDDIDPKKIINDIKYFYRNGKFPKSKFHSFGESFKRRLKLNESLFESINEVDSDGNELSEQQVKFFKDSKIRDNSGKLLLVYHGTNVNFDEFKKERNDGSRTRVQSFWFSSSSDIASTYHNNSGKVLSGYLNIKNPFIYDCKNSTWSKIPVNNKLLDLLQRTDNPYWKESGKIVTSTNDILNAIYMDSSYDGIILKHIKDFGAYYKNINYKLDGDDYIIFNSNQFKLVSNKNPTNSNKINEDFDIVNNKQEYTSANTSINSSKLPAVFNIISFKPNTINLDYGGGKFDNATEFLKTKDVTNLVYDPYNRSIEHNNEVLDIIRKNNGADTVTCSNVLNVIKEENIRFDVINNIYKLLKTGGIAYFTVYEGDRSNNARPTKAGYQLNRKTIDYLNEIKSVFNDVEVKGKLIKAIK